MKLPLPFTKKGIEAAPVAKAGKMSRLRVWLLKEFAIGLGIALALAAGAFLLSEWALGAEKVRNDLNSEVNLTTNQVTTLESRLNRAEKSLPMYQQLTKNNPDGEIPLDRPQAGDLLNRLKEQYYFNSLQVGLAPVKEMDGQDYKNSTMIGISCEISLVFEAPTDEHAVQFLHALKEALPGSVKVNAFSVGLSEKNTPGVDPQLLNELRQSGKGNLVKGETKLVWQGMKSVVKPVPAPGAAGAGL